MSIPLEHLQSLVPGDGGYFHETKPLLEESGCGFVAEIVEMQTLDARMSQRP